MSNLEIPKLDSPIPEDAKASSYFPPTSSLPEQAQNQTIHALRCGALQSIQTDYEFVEQGGVSFLVRILSNLVRKEKAINKQKKLGNKGEDFNPFLPYEPDLFVQDLSPTHLCLLNKFNVVNHHLLVVTRQFEEQECWLNYNDFFALWVGLRQIDGLAFYNGGKTAGASQRHKHLQLIPMPLAPEGIPIPIESILLEAKEASPGCLSALPFKHQFVGFSLTPELSSEEAAQMLLGYYRELLNRAGSSWHPERDRPTLPYNLLITRRWMLLIPRLRENAHSISVNALGFAGSLFVKNSDQLQLLKEKGPMTLLQHVGYSRNPTC